MNFSTRFQVVPHICEEKNKEGKTAREQYNDERGVLAYIASERNRPIFVDDSRQKLPQPCQEFVVHDELEIVQRLYNDGNLALLANVGVLNRPVNKTNYNELTTTQLFAHNAMQLEVRGGEKKALPFQKKVNSYTSCLLLQSERVDPFSTLPNTGVLGRALDMLEVRSDGLSIDTFSVSVQGVNGKSPETTVVSQSGNKRFNPAVREGSKWDILEEIYEANDATRDTSNVYAEAWSEGLTRAIDEADSLKAVIDNVELRVPLEQNGGWDRKMAVVSKLIQSHNDRGVTRDVIHVTIGNWDHHNSMKRNLRANFNNLNRVLTHFVDEMKALDLWDNVTLVINSDFARTLTPNSGSGSDHAWGGHYFMMGGKVKGAQIHGQYPYDITVNGPLNIGGGRGRLIPELSWESIWNGVVQWFGVKNELDLDHVMPNRKGNGAVLLNKADLYND